MAGAPPGYRIEALASAHDRSGFACGEEALDRYLRNQAGQDTRRRVASCFVATRTDEPAVLGYFTLSATAIALEKLPDATAKRLPRYDEVPATLLGRLAVDLRERGQRLGETLMLDAFARTLRSEIATFAFVVDAKNEAAGKFYARYGFLPLDASGRRLFMPMAEIAKLFA